jgi:mono/diheme cytochrome c family protein
MRHIACVLVVTAALGCAKKESAETGSAPPPPPAPSPAMVEAQNLYGTVCATCHGPGGRGDGPAAANLNPKARDYTDKAWQASVGDAEIRKTILEGGLAVGKSPIMPAQPQLADKPETLDAMVQIIRGFAK